MKFLFIALAKESATSTVLEEEEEEDWVLVKDDIPAFQNVLI